MMMFGRERRFLLGALILAAAMPVFALASSANDRSLILDLDRCRAAAFVSGDVAFLDRVTGAGYTHVETTGVARARAEFLEERRRGTVRFRRFDIERNDVRVLGDVAIVTGRYVNQIETRSGLQPAKRARHLRVYVRQEGRWRVLAHQATEIPDTP